MTPTAQHAHRPNTESASPQLNSSKEHPIVSEQSEGKPVAEWMVCLVVLSATAFAAFGHTEIGIAVLASCSAILGCLRLTLQEKSPWKVRSVGFDSVMCIGLAIGLLVTYLSILWLF